MNEQTTAGNWEQGGGNLPTHDEVVVDHIHLSVPCPPSLIKPRGHNLLHDALQLGGSEHIDRKPPRELFEQRDKHVSRRGEGSGLSLNASRAVQIESEMDSQGWIVGERVVESLNLSRGVDQKVLSVEDR